MGRYKGCPVFFHVKKLTRVAGATRRTAVFAFHISRDPSTNPVITMQQSVRIKHKKIRGPKRSVVFYGDRLQQAREATDRTQENMVGIDLSLSSIQRAERGKPVSYETAMAICSLLEIQPEKYLAPKAGASASAPAIINNITELTRTEQNNINRLPKTYIGRFYSICVDQIGQAAFDDFIVDNDDGLSGAAGTAEGDTIRFQVADGEIGQAGFDASTLVIYRVHSDGALADRINTECDLRVGFYDAGNLKGKYFILEFRGKYKELTCGFVDHIDQREWASLWRLFFIVETLSELKTIQNTDSAVLQPLFSTPDDRWLGNCIFLICEQHRIEQFPDVTRYMSLP
ncbi:helix-turn-helix domain-containing protein [Methylobacterium sp. Leaf118]|uniref:helix-turn-helix domain-containing protein n=1 Tax=Methylobacterium sp. Leaf118 TaxID=2876562 RepID=UPI001E2BEAB2|nr:helix-turn-helix transcriptional regulator [Methylobacterium sp. Leaf118]